MAFSFKKFFQGINIYPTNATTQVDAGGDLDVNTTDGKLTYYNSVEALASPIVTEAGAAPLTNKSMDGLVNTFTNLPSSSFITPIPPQSGGTGVANNSASTLTISGHFGTTLTISNTTTATLQPTQGIIVGRSTTDTLTNKSIDGGSNTLTDISLSSLDTIASDTMLGNNTGSSAVPAALTISQVNTLLGNLSNPMTTTGDTIYGGSSGLATRLAGNTTATKEFLSQTGTGSASAAPVWATVASTFISPTVQTFLTSSGTYNTPGLHNPLYLKVKVLGGGGGGGASGTTNGGQGGTGGATTFGGILSAGGGIGALGLTGAAGGSNTISAGPVVIFNQTGATGCSGGNNESANVVVPGGYGAGSILGSGGSSGAGNAGMGSNALANSGAGGGGAASGSTTSSSSGAGGGAGGYIEVIISGATLATIISSGASYSIGSGGAGGTLGTSGAAGGNGGSGQIIVEEYYQ